jgi:hypothetical protein
VTQKNSKPKESKNSPTFISRSNRPPTMGVLSPNPNYRITVKKPLCGSLPPQPVFCSHPTTSSRGAQAIFLAKPFHVLYPTFSTAVTLHTYSPMKMEQSVPKRRHLNYRRRGITQKKAYDRHKYVMEPLCP